MHIFNREDMLPDFKGNALNTIPYLFSDRNPTEEI